MNNIMTHRFKFVDLFAGIGGFHLAMHELGGECVMACEIDRHCREVYHTNFKVNSPKIFDNEMFISDITTIKDEILDGIPDFDLLCAGFPCQPFSQAGHQEGFLDINRGNLFFDILRIIANKRPRAFLLENVRNLLSHDKGATFERIKEEIEYLGYSLDYKIIKASEHGLPQHRPRIYLVGFDRSQLTEEPSRFEWPESVPLRLTMRDIWECQTCDREIGYTLRVGGRCSPYGDRHNWDQYMVDGEIRTLGPKQGLMMQGFPKGHILSPMASRAMKQLGNSVAVSVVKAIGIKMLEYMEK